MVTSLRHRLAVLAIDPSSERSGGSILGDKTRMESITNNPDVFIRPSPSAGSLGGVARKTRETIVLCEAAGFDVIFIETVGVGQSETAVHSMVDMFMLLQISGAGDELQGIKRGIMEMADMMVITKADGENLHKAELARTQFQSALRLFPMPESEWRPRVYTCSSVDRTGLEEVWAGVEQFLEHTGRNGYFTHNRSRQNKYWMYETINETLRNAFYRDPRVEAAIGDCEQRVLDARRLRRRPGGAGRPRRTAHVPARRGGALHRDPRRARPDGAFAALQLQRILLRGSRGRRVARV